MSQARKQNEIAFHDRLFGAQDADPRRPAAKFYSASDETHTFYHRLVVRHARGKRLLEYGCGTGGDSLFWARSGARVTGIDLSGEAIRQAREHAAAEGARVDFHVMDAEDLRFEDATFDVVVGSGILHHLNPRTCYPELARVLRPDGHAFFVEPMGHNPWINLYRRYTPAMRTEDEHPLLVSDLRLARQYFEGVDAKFFNLFTLLAVPFRRLPGFRRLRRALIAVDELVFAALPFTGKYAWMVVLHLTQPRATSRPPRGRGVLAP